MQSLRDFFVFCSGAEGAILRRTPSEYNKYASIGATIFFTGVFAFIAGAFAIYTIFNSYAAAIFFGMVWGLMIFNLDRYIVSSMKNTSSFAQNFLSAAPRIILAIIIAVVISKPLELKIFQTEIESELVSMEQEKYKIQEDKLRARYTEDITDLQASIKTKEAKVAALVLTRDQLNNQAIKEADGTGGSLKRNMGPIYKVKKIDAEKAQSELDALNANIGPEIANDKSELAELQADEKQALADLKKVSLSGFAARLDALGRLSGQSSTIFWASIFIVLLFIAVETAPVFVKLISRRSPYDLVLHKLEHQYEMNHKSITEKRQLETDLELDHLKKTESHQNGQVITAENELFNHSLKQEVERLKRENKGWKHIFRGKRIITE